MCQSSQKGEEKGHFLESFKKTVSREKGQGNYGAETRLDLHVYLGQQTVKEMFCEPNYPESFSQENCLLHCVDDEKESHNEGI